MFLPIGASTSVVALCFVTALPVAAQSRSQSLAATPAYNAPAPAVVVDVAGPRYRFPRLRAAAAAALQRRLGVVPPQPQPAPVAAQGANGSRPNAAEQDRTRGNEPTLAATAASERLPDESDFRAMEDAELIAALDDLSRRLNQRLARLTTGEGWQRYLKLSEETVGIYGTAGLDAEHLADALDRFDSVSVEKDYEMIATMPSFEATHAALRHVVRRVDAGATLEEGPLLTSPNPIASHKPVAYESLPTPEPDPAPAEAAKGEERSVLKRTTRE